MSAGGSSETGYDRIGVPGHNGEVRFLTRAQFEALPLAERVSLLMGGKLQFFRDGRQLSPREALRGT